MTAGMLIRVILLTLLAGIGYYAFARRHKVPIHIILVLGLLGLGALFVIVPELTNRIAHAVGVGRGADLISYLVEVLLLFVIIHYYTKFVELESQVTRLVREIALLRAEIESATRDRPSKSGS
jgi:small membrane protein